jgi:hypothetical protein
MRLRIMSRRLKWMVGRKRRKDLDTALADSAEAVEEAAADAVAVAQLRLPPLRTRRPKIPWRC